jgi:hypothetical protein
MGLNSNGSISGFFNDRSPGVDNWLNCNLQSVDDKMVGPSQITTYLGTYRFLTLYAFTEIPKYGWVQSLETQRSAAKKSRSAGAQLRLAITLELQETKDCCQSRAGARSSEGEQRLSKRTSKGKGAEGKALTANY